MNAYTLEFSRFDQKNRRMVESLWYGLGRMTVDVMKHILYNLDVVYQTPLPAGAKILCANHPTTIDPVLMTTLVPEQVSILIHETLFKVPGLGRSLAAAGHIPVFSNFGRQALEDGIETLKAGRTVGIFPEGAISPVEGGMARVHTGAARLALSSGVPVIPIGIALNKDHITRIKTVVDGQVEVGTWYFHGDYVLTVGKPMLFQGDPNSRELVRAVTAQIVQRIMELSQESNQRLAAREIKTPSIVSWFRHLRLPNGILFNPTR